tara:strand:+ start:14 stop:943 length:930 start_codon:yes stop_codon:yes gene_type:complete
MKIKIFLTFLCSFLIFSSSNAFTFNDYEIGQKIEYELILDKKIKVDLSPGKWELVEKEKWNYNAFSGYYISAIKLNQNKIEEAISLSYLGTQGKRHADVNTFIYELVFKNKHDGCYKRPEYFNLSLYNKGATVNCMIVRHVDINKELYNPDDKELAYLDANLIRYIEDNSIELPNIALRSAHIIFDRSISQKYYALSHIINPEFFKGPMNKFMTENDSEYHPLNISKYPAHKKFMNKFLSKSSLFHQDIENKLGVKNQKKLEISNYITEVPKNEINDNTISQLKKLNELFKAGVLNKEEFEKAKKKILD